MPIKYTYKISDGTDDVGCFPLYDSSASMITDMEGDEVFHRTKFSGTMTFIGEAASFIIGSDVETRFEIQQKKFNYTTGSYGDVTWTGEFWKTDCTIDEDENRVEVKPATVDNYTELMRGIEKEFNLISLSPKTTAIAIQRQPILQVYVAGEDYLTNFVGTTYWEQEVVAPENSFNVLVGTYFFEDAFTLYYIPGPDVAPAEVVGSYTYDPGTGDYDSTDYVVRFNNGANRWEILDKNSGLAVRMTGTTAESDVFATVFTSTLGTGTTTQLFQREFYVRILTNRLSVSGNATDLLPEDDIVASNPNYTRALGVETDNFLPASNFLTTATRYGKPDIACENVSNSEYYFQKPDSVPSNEGVYPVSRTSWSCFAIWFYFDDTLRALQESGSEDIVIRDCYHLFDVLDVLINAIDPTINLASSTDNSQFYFDATNPISGIANLDYFLTPKSNILVGNYDQPASKADIKLADLLKSLWAVHRVKWYIDDDKNFRLEHINFFEKGGSYTTDIVGTDVSTFVEPQTGKAWGFKQNSYTYLKQKMPERYEFEWMDDGSFAFDGYPININSNYTNAGQIEKERAINLTSDIDFMFADPSSVNERGFSILIADTGTIPATIPFLEFIVNNETYNIQNGRLSFLYLHPVYHVYDLPSPDVEVNDNTVVATSIKRTKQQQVLFVAELSQDPMQLITTGLGTGRVKMITENLNDGQKTITIHHDTE